MGTRHFAVAAAFALLMGLGGVAQANPPERITSAGDVLELADPLGGQVQLSHGRSWAHIASYPAGHLIVTTAGGYAVFLGIVVVFHAWLGSERGAIESALIVARGDIIYGAEVDSGKGIADGTAELLGWTHEALPVAGRWLVVAALVLTLVGMAVVVSLSPRAGSPPGPKCAGAPAPEASSTASASTTSGGACINACASHAALPSMGFGGYEGGTPISSDRKPFCPRRSHTAGSFTALEVAMDNPA